MSEILDETELMERIDNDLEFLADALELYNEDYPELISQMRSALSRQDSGALADAAHTFKGLLGNFAAHPAIEVALKLEVMAKQGDLSGAGQALTALENESNRLQEALEAIVQQG